MTPGKYIPFERCRHCGRFRIDHQLKGQHDEDRCLHAQTRFEPEPPAQGTLFGSG